jgi:GNAT superfamily N-acetyltransferase
LKFALSDFRAGRQQAKADREGMKNGESLDRQKRASSRRSCGLQPGNATTKALGWFEEEGSWKMLLNKAVASDFAAIVELANLAYRGPFDPAESNQGWYSESGIVEGLRLTEELMKQDLAAKPNAFLLTCRDNSDGSLLGTVWLEPVVAHSDKGQGDGVQPWYLGLLTVTPGLQNRQLGCALLAAAEAFAKDRGATRMRMTVVNVRDALIAWYLRRGYGLTGEIQPFPYGDRRFGKPLRYELHFVVLEKPL